MERIQFVNREMVKRGETNKALRVLLIICAALLTFAILIMIIMEDSVSVFVALIMPVFLWRAALSKPAKQSVTVLTDEELERTDDGICLHIKQIDRGDNMGTHQERIVYPRERMKSLVFYTKSNIVEVTGRPIFHFQSDKESSTLDTTAFENDYQMRIYCTEDNCNDILRIFQDGFMQTAVQIEDY